MPTTVAVASEPPSKQYSSSQFLESAGTILFSHHEPFSNPPTSTLKICLLHSLSSNQLLLPCGRRSLAESRAEAALRSTQIQTGCRCSMLPVNLETRCTLPMFGGARDRSDRVRKETVQGEAFYVTHRELGEEEGVQVTWWYVAVADEGQVEEPARVIDEGDFRPAWVAIEEMEGLLGSEGEIEVVRKAVGLVRGE